MEIHDLHYVNLCENQQKDVLDGGVGTSIRNLQRVKYTIHVHVHNDCVTYTAWTCIRSTQFGMRE